ncbi:hypothetical protein L861_04630 [Litchfieldella anticariensis FP35 = DSM 16096]|uniref:Uncharacterized protein n=1 Tax=Litchfieldella anticariensis (strain DSM 16096 / CECT 5854 / CIP 108499 / LMG 22089 / FP35) TaxID=1121939 RepID=S2KRA4_LITA3|nr:hypothetical protein L861_04630 [Halomonas anticariensis FP35 = DSM 16096]
MMRFHDKKPLVEDQRLLIFSVYTERDPIL